MKKVLMTGAAGVIGSNILPHLRNHFEMYPTDLEPVQADRGFTYVGPPAGWAMTEPSGPPGQGHWSRLDVTDLDAVAAALRGKDAVMHLAIAPFRKFTAQESRHYAEAMLQVDAQGTYHVLEAARLAGVKRVVLAGSITVHWGYDLPPGRMVRADEPFRPSGLYAAIKCFNEVLGETYARTHGLEVISLRIGAIAESAKPESWLRYRRNPLDIRAVVTFEDIARGFACAVQADHVSFAAVNLTSQNAEPYLELDSARAAIGYEPMHHIEGPRCIDLRRNP